MADRNLSPIRGEEKQTKLPDDLSPPESDLEGGINIESVINEKSLLRKIDIKLLPAVGILYLLSFLDRSNVGNAKIEGLAKDLNMNPLQYHPQAHTSPRLWLPTLTIAWGIVATLMGVVHNLAGFFVARLFLGITESGLFPGVVFYFSMWYRRRERQFRISLFFSTAALAGSFGGILAYGIGFMKGTVWANGWHWIFILEGLATIVVAVAAYWFIYNYPDTAQFLTDKERAFVRARLAADSDATHDEAFTWGNVLTALKDPKCWLYSLTALKDPKCWLYGLSFHTMSLPLYTYSLFLPTIISALGYTAANAQLLTIPPYAFAFATTLAIAGLSEHLNQRGLFIAGSASFAAVGYAILLGNTDPVGRPGVSYAGTFLAAGGIYPATALSLSWPAINVSGQTKRAVANAMQISVGNLGAVLGTQLYRALDGPRYVVGHSFALGYLLGNVVVSGLLYWVLKRENEKRDSTAAEVREVGELTDWRGDEDPRWRFQI